MIGNITQPNSELLESMNPNIYIMDIRNYTWLEPTNVLPNLTQPSTTPSISPNQFNNKLVTIKIIIGVISAIVGIVIIIISGIFCYKSFQNRQNNGIIRISGNNRESNIIYSFYL